MDHAFHCKTQEWYLKVHIDHLQNLISYILVVCLIMEYAVLIIISYSLDLILNVQLATESNNVSNSGTSLSKIQTMTLDFIHFNKNSVILATWQATTETTAAT